MRGLFTYSLSLFVWGCVLLAVPREGWGRGEKKGKCEVCKNFVKAFEEGLKSTQNSNFEGGDTLWEEEKLGSYANSEVRFVEILDGVCSDYECHRLVEEYEEHIERWWFKMRHEKSDLKQWFCHDQLDVCCPENMYGPTCEVCPGGVESPCGGRGTCEGAEEKDGLGTCRCNHGYSGDACMECDEGFYNDSNNCIGCHRACNKGCSGGGASDCVECASGYTRTEESSECKDINECEEGLEEGDGGETKAICEEGKYCFNTQGSYRCNDCDKSCERACLGAGPARCVNCANGYFMNKYNICKDMNECEGGEGWDGDPVKCEGATFCENTPGSHQCKACHIACLGGCKGVGPTNCDECKDGFNMDDGECKDINECEEDLPCDDDVEICSNLIGSFKCKCKPGLVRVDEVCVEEITKEKEPKKKKKKKNTIKKGDKAAITPEEREKERLKKLVETMGERGGGRGGIGEFMNEMGSLMEEVGAVKVGSGEGLKPIPKSHDRSQKSHDQSQKSHDSSFADPIQSVEDKHDEL